MSSTPCWDSKTVLFGLAWYNHPLVAQGQRERNQLRAIQVTCIRLTQMHILVERAVAPPPLKQPSSGNLLHSATRADRPTP